MHAHAHSCIHTCIYTAIHTHIAHMHTHTSVHIPHTHACTHTHIHTHMHIHSHAYAQQEAASDLLLPHSLNRDQRNNSKPRMRKNKSKMMWPKLELLNLFTRRAGAQRGLGLPSRPAFFILSHGNSKT